MADLRSACTEALEPGIELPSDDIMEIARSHERVASALRALDAYVEALSRYDSSVEHNPLIEIERSRLLDTRSELEQKLSACRGRTMSELGFKAKLLNDLVSDTDDVATRLTLSLCRDLEQLENQSE